MSALTEKVNQLKDKHEMLSSLLPDIRLLYGTQPGPRTPVMYQPGIVFLFSGHKIGYINERTFRYDTNEYLLLTVPLPFECETLPPRRCPRDAPERRYPAAAGAADGHWRGSAVSAAVASSGINSAVLGGDLVRCGTAAGRDGAAAGRAYLGKQIIREILYTC
jgi:hypothetical protein